MFWCHLQSLSGNKDGLKKAIISGIVFCSILLVGCNGEQNEEQVQTEMIQQIVEDSIKNVSETKNVTISEEENITIKIEKY